MMISYLQKYTYWIKLIRVWLKWPWATVLCFCMYKMHVHIYEIAKLQQPQPHYPITMKICVFHEQDVYINPERCRWLVEVQTTSVKLASLMYKVKTIFCNLDNTNWGKIATVLLRGKLKIVLWQAIFLY